VALTVDHPLARLKSLPLKKVAEELLIYFSELESAFSTIKQPRTAARSLLTCHSPSSGVETAMEFATRVWR
jgi:hypothetical protein